MSSIRERLAAINDYKAERVVVPEWEGLEFEVRSLSIAARTRLYQSTALEGGGVDMEKFTPALVIATVYDPETGAPAFDESDEALLQGMSATAVDRLTEVAMRIGGMTKDGVEEGKDDS